MERAATRENIVLNVIHELESQSTIREFVAHGLAYTLLTKSAILFDRDPQRFVTIPVAGLQLTRTLVLNQRTATLPVVALLASIVESVVTDVLKTSPFDEALPGPNLAQA